MDAEPREVRFEDLLAHAGWARALAGRLVADPQAADDLVQDTWLAALEGPPSRGDNPRGWLASVLRNRARSRGRSEKRRSRRELAGASEERAPSAAQLAERLDTQRLLAELVTELAEPYRRTLLLRFYEGLSSAEIARRTGTAQGTVRWRLKQAVDELRAQLDERHGGERGSWLPAVAALVPTMQEKAAGTGLVVSLKGLLVMNTLLKTSLAAAAAVAVVAGVGYLGYVGLTSTGGLRGVDGVPVPTARPVAQGRGVVQPPAEARTPERTAAAPTVARPPEREPTYVPPRTPTIGHLTARVIDEAGRPIEGARLFRTDGQEVTYAPVGRGEEPDPPRDSRANGEFALEFNLRHNEGRPLSVSLQIDAAGYASVERDALLVGEQTISLGDIVLRPGRVVAGRVEDEGGRPVGQAWVHWDSEPGSDLEAEKERLGRSDPFGPSGCVHTDSEGRYRTPGLPVGSIRMWAGHDDSLAGFSPVIEIEPLAEPLDVDLVLEALPAEHLITGQVVDPEGRPVPRANVNFRYSSWFSSGSASVAADEHGRFRQLIHPDAPRDIRAKDPKGRFGEVLIEDVQRGTAGLVITLLPLEPLVLRIVGADDKPVRAASILVKGRSQLQARPREHQSQDGVYRLDTPKEPFDLKVVAKGYAEWERSGMRPGASEVVECVLRPLPDVRGRVTSAAGPVAGAEVSLWPISGQKTWVETFPSRYAPKPSCVAYSGEDGSFGLTVREKGRYVLRAESDGFASSELGPFDIDPVVGAADLEAVLSQGGAIEGRVLVDAGESPVGRVVAISRSDGRPRSAYADAEGRFRFDRLTPGPWQVEERERVLDHDGWSSRSTGFGAHDDLPSNVIVREGETVHFDLDLRSGARPELAGEIRFEGPAADAPRSYRALAVPAEKLVVVAGEETNAVFSSETSFRLGVKGPGRYRLLVEALGNGWDGVRWMEEIEIVPGGVAWELEFAGAELAVENVPASQGQLPAALVLWEEGTRTGLALLQAEAGGTVELARVPAGRARVVRLDPIALATGDLSALPTLLELDVPEGERTVARLP